MLKLLEKLRLERKFRVFDDGVKASQVWSWLDQGETCVCSPSCSYFHMNDTFKHVRSSISKRETTHRMTRTLQTSRKPETDEEHRLHSRDTFLSEQQIRGVRRSLLRRLLVTAGDEGVLVRGQAPSSRTLTRLVRRMTDGGPGYLVPFHTFEAMRSADQWEEKGVPVPALSDMGAVTDNPPRIYPRFGVFPPTRQDYIDLFGRLLGSWNGPGERSTGDHSGGPAPGRWGGKAPARVLEVGSGSGVLSFLMAKTWPGARVTGLDISGDAVDCARYNRTLLGLGSDDAREGAQRLQFWHLDPLSTAGGRELTSLVAGSDKDAVTDTAAGMFDLVLCNPPWVPNSVGGLPEEGDIPGAAGVLQGLPLLSLAAGQLDGAVFDASSKGMLSRTVSLAGTRLRPGGHLVIVYSTLAFELGLESRDRVEEEGVRCGFEVVLKVDAPRGCAFSQSPTVKDKSAPDPLAAPKKREVVSVYVFQKC